MPEGAAPTTGTAPSVFGWQDVNYRDFSNNAADWIDIAVLIGKAAKFVYNKKAHIT